MKKLLALSFFSMFVASQANAAFIKTVEGDDMAGIEVTAVFSDSSSETLVWASLGGSLGGVGGTYIPGGAGVLVVAALTLLAFRIGPAGGNLPGGGLSSTAIEL